jgi:acetylornithine deacetylase
LFIRYYVDGARFHPIATSTHIAQVMSLPVDADFIREILVRLVQTNSVNPILDPESRGEGEVARLIAGRLDAMGLEVETPEPEPGRTSVLGTMRGGGGGRSLMLNAHIDTVGVEGMRDPFSGTIENGRLYGRGSFDMKGAMAACIGAVKALVDGGVSLAGDLVIAGVADEEYSSIGTTDVIGRCKVDGAIVTEPTQLGLCLAHKGYVWLKVTTAGRAAHGSRFEEGVDANLRMGRVLSELERLEEKLRTGPPHPLVGPPSLHAALLSGGTGVSTYAASSELHIERRTIPGETPDQVLQEIQEIIDRLEAEDASFRATVERYFARDPFEVGPDAEVVRAVERGAAKVLGRVPPHMGDTPWMDAALLAAAGVETVVIGPSGTGAHAAAEWVDLESVVQLAGVLAVAAIEYCGLH